MYAIRSYYASVANVVIVWAAGALAAFLTSLLGGKTRLYSGFISPEGAEGWRIRGRLIAKLVQSCVVTLA